MGTGRPAAFVLSGALRAGICEGGSAAVRVLVCGGRHYNDEERVFAVLNNYDADYNFTMLIQGGAKGADSAARKWAMIANA